MNDLEPVWSGDLWRSFVDRPVHETPKAMRLSARQPSERREQVYAVITDEWQNIRVITHRCGLKVDTVRDHLTILRTLGLIEQDRRIRELRGRCLVYRRVGQA